MLRDANPFAEPAAGPQSFFHRTHHALTVWSDGNGQPVIGIAAHLGIAAELVPLAEMADRPAHDVAFLALTPAAQVDLSAIAARQAEEALSLCVACSMHQIDDVLAAFDDDDLTLLVDPSPLEIEIALADRFRTVRGVVHSLEAQDRDREIVALQDEVQRISRMLARMSMESSPAPADIAAPAPSPFIEDCHVESPRRSFERGDSEPARATVTPRDARLVIRQRRLRDELFDATLFADPAWDMLLDLYAARLGRMRVSVSSLCIAAAVPATTALRWIKTLTDSGLFIRQSDPLDGRRIFVALSDAATDAMHRYFARLNDARLAI